jgi:hypothetical protein
MSSGVAPVRETTSLENTESVRLVKSLELTVKDRTTREWESAFDKSVIATLDLWKRDSSPHFEEPISPHAFPSYRSLTLRALESLSEIFDKRPCKKDTYYD